MGTPRWTGLLALTLVPLGAACNDLTGASDVEIVADDDDAKTPPPKSPGPGVVASTSGSSGAGGSGGGTPAPTVCTWPPGPFGVSPNQIVPESLSWQGYAAGSDVPGTVAVRDFYDCDGSKAIDAVMFSTSQWG
jgi:hypothetical protein